MKKHYFNLATAVLLVVFALVSWTIFLLQYFHQFLIDSPDYLYDDAFMFLRYARIFLAGYGESWNVHEGPLYGNTSQLHFMVVVLLRYLTPWRDEMVLLLSSAIPALLSALYLPWLLTKHGKINTGKPLFFRYCFWFATAASALVFFSSLSFHFKSGMDTCLSLLINLLLIDAVLEFEKNPARHKKLVVIFCAYAAFLVRPDNLIVCFSFPVLYLFYIRKDYKVPLQVALSIAALIFMDFIIKKWYFGDFFPLSVYAKQVGFNKGYAGTIRHHPLFTFAHFLYGIWPFLFMGTVFYQRKNLVPILIFIIPAIITCAYFFTIQTIMNLEARYFFPFTVYFAVAATLYLEPFEYKKHWLRLVLLTAAFTGLYWAIGLVHQYRWPITRFFEKEPELCDYSVLDQLPGKPELPKLKNTSAYLAMADMLAKLPAGVTVAMSEYGYVGARNPYVNILDVVGLHNRYIAHHGYSVQWFYQQQPDAIWIPHWDYTCLNAETFSDVHFQQEYEFYPYLFATGYALRKDSPYYVVLKENLDITWKTLYPGLTLADYRKF